MAKKSSVLIAALLIFLTNTAFNSNPALQTQVTTQGSWSWLLIVILIIIGVALLMIVRANATPSAVAEYGLDQHGHDQSDVHAALEGVVTAASADDSHFKPVNVNDTATADDLTLIEGIGPKIAALLNAEGIRSFQDLADAPPETLTDILKTGGSSFGFADPNSWPEQARLASQGNWDEFHALTNRLKGGR
jgi:predicted flap endonuclease-1-like 5' DNA nuclease